MGKANRKFIAEDLEKNRDMIATDLLKNSKIRFYSPRDIAYEENEVRKNV